MWSAARFTWSGRLWLLRTVPPGVSARESEACDYALAEGSVGEQILRGEASFGAVGS